MPPEKVTGGLADPSARCRNDGFKIGEGSGALRRTPHSQRYQPACKPGSVGHRLLAQAIRDGHSSGTTFARCLEQPTRTASLTSPCGVFAFANEPALPSLFGLAPGVVCHAVSVAGPAVRSYRTFSPLLAVAACAAMAQQARGPVAPKPRRAKAGGSFSVALSLGSPPPDVIRHRMSMEPGLSSPAAFRP
jgi:hypothetical protein